MVAQMLARMLPDVKTEVFGEEGQGGAGAVGLAMEWAEYFVGSHPPGGLLAEHEASQSDAGGTRACVDAWFVRG